MMQEITVKCEIEGKEVWLTLEVEITLKGASKDKPIPKKEYSSPLIGKRQKIVLDLLENFGPLRLYQIKELGNFPSGYGTHICVNRMVENGWVTKVSRGTYQLSD
tara:strand:+ start:1316 stop:1630 length:315 start_codon:yes stop_codon:yes gene_type:complete